MIELPASLFVWTVCGTIPRTDHNRWERNVTSTVLARNASMAIQLHLAHFGPNAVVYACNKAQKGEVILMEGEQ